MLRVTQSNRLEELAGAIAEALPAGDPFARPTIVVSSRLVGRWLQYELARRRGIAAGLDLPFLEPFLQRSLETPQLRGLDRLHLAALIASALADPALVAEAAMAPVRAYLDGADPEVRRVQLAQRVSLLFWDYALTRPDWLDAWDDGAEADVGEADAATLGWQRRLYLQIRQTDRALIPRLPHARRRLGIAAPVLPAPVHLVGFSYLARAHLDALTLLAQNADVHVALVTPCAEFWEDVPGRRRGSESDDPLALQLWGSPGRDTSAMLVSAVEGNVVERHVEVEARTALQAWAGDVLRRTGRPEPGKTQDAPRHAQPGIRVLACPSLARELEIVGSEIWKLLRENEGLRASDVAVLIAGDRDRYVAQVGPVFGSLHRLPFHLVDAPAASSGRVAEAALQLLELPLGRFTRREMLALMTHPAVLARHPHVDPADWTRWCERLGIAHGADGSDHAGTYLDGESAFHWAQGIERLSIGAFVAGPRAGADEPVHIGRELLPEELAPDQEASAATFALLARSLIADARWLVGRAEPLARWAQILPALVHAYLADVGETDIAAARGALAEVGEELAGLADLDLDDRPVPYREVVELARGRLGGLREGRGEPLAHGVRVAPLAPMAPLPAAATFIVGLGEGEFPAGDQPSPLDLRGPRKRGDVAPRDRDRYAFLEAVLATRGPLYLSYVARDEQSGDPRAPSSVVHELVEMLTPYLDDPAALTVTHPLRRWDEAYEHDPRLTPSVAPAAARERHAITVRRSLDAHLVERKRAAPDAPRLRELLAEPSLRALRTGLRLDLADGVPPIPDDADTPVVISIATLRRFLEAPVQAWAQIVLRLDSQDGDDDGAEREDEPFDDGAKERTAALREAFALVLGAGGETPLPVAEAYARVRRRRELAGHAPLGPFGAAAQKRDLERLAQWMKWLGDADGRWTRIAFARAGVRGADLRPALSLEAEVRGRRRTIEIVGTTELIGGEGLTRSVVLINRDPTDEHRLRHALDHLVLSAAGLPDFGSGDREGLVLGQKIDRQRLGAWTRADAAAQLGLLVGELLGQHHAYYLPFHTAKSALEGTPKRRVYNNDDPQPPLGWGPLDRDPGLPIPPDAAAIAARRVEPILRRLVKIKERS